MEHLQKELSIECLLFIVEAYQYRNYCIKILNPTEVKTKYENLFSRLKVHPNIPQSNIICSKMNTPSNSDNLKDGIPHTKIEMTYITSDSPVSIDVYPTNNNDIKDIKQRAYLIFRKYIQQNCEFQVNIKYKTNSTLTTYMNDKESWLNNELISPNKLITIFDEACYQVFNLLYQPLRRSRINSH
mmetsp:Transcript_28708/g.35182  ORF Transcript_28708/g.35182 Transcript_28708/m.35182 type:complete len:185 (+) Transcript_28708:3-557(+)